MENLKGTKRKKNDSIFSSEAYPLLFACQPVHRSLTKTEHGCWNPEHDCRNPDHDCRNPEHGCRNPEHFCKYPELGCRNPELDCRNPEHGCLRLIIFWQISLSTRTIMKMFQVQGDP